MKKMTDEDLLDILQRHENSAATYVHGQLGTERELSMREYHRLPYGNEEDGWSHIVASDIQDTVEWILPVLLKIFSSTDKAVSFDPTRESDVKGAEQATDTCNYVFFKQNNGFLILYTAFKDALTVKNSATMWRKETVETVSTIPFKGASEEMIAMLMQGEDAQIQESTPAPILDQQGQPQIDPMTGQPMMGYNGRIKMTEKKTVIKVESFAPEDLLVARDWTSPLLDECPYVARMMLVSLSDVKLMGFKDVTAMELRASDQSDYSADASFRLSKVNQADALFSEHRYDEQTDDDSMAEGWLRLEYILADVDGDGIAERICVYRLRDKILKTEVCSHVPIATFSPILNTHRWDGMSMSDVVSDLQKLHTELLRQTLNNLYLTNNPRTKVLTDANWSPLANIDDLLDSRAGGIIRQRDANAVTEQVTPFSAGASMPMLEYVEQMRETRTGVSRTSQGLNPDSLNNTATGRQIDASAAAQRIELIARIAAETLLKPIFRGILKLLTEGGMEKLAFRLRDEFIEYDPNEWRDQYDMTVNVGLGTGDTQQKAQQLMMILQMQQSGLALGLATPKHIYNAQAKLVENAGFKDIQNFIQDPDKAPPQQPQVPLPLQIEQMKLQGAQQTEQLKAQLADQLQQREIQRDIQLEQNKQEMQARDTMNTQLLEAEKAKLDAQIAQEKYNSDQMHSMQLEQIRLDSARMIAELKAATDIEVAKIKALNTLDTISLNAQNAAGLEVASTLGDGGTDPMAQQPQGFDMAAMLQAMSGKMDAMHAQLQAPRKIVRGPDGKAVGVDIGGMVKPINRDAGGRVQGY